MADSTSEVTIIGAGPYGLSIAAHLRAAGTEFRIFGSPMQTWRKLMPVGMFLKSEGCASNLSDPDGSYILERFCKQERHGYGDYAVPVSLDIFTRYGLSFQQQQVPEVQESHVTALRQAPGGFAVELDTGETVTTRRAVVAVGTTYFAHIPETLRHLPRELLSHSSEHRSLSGFRGRDVTIIGAGQSALETAALLRENGAYPRVLVRQHSVAWNADPTAIPRSLPKRIRRPSAGLGAGWRTLFYSEAPGAFYYLPERNRIRAVRTVLGPAGAWWLKERVVGKLPILLGHSIRAADWQGERVRLVLDQPDNGSKELLTDHVIAATGYRVDLRALPFLDPPLQSQLRRVGQSPVVSRDFESSVEGLYFVGLAAANHFGPVMRFVYGADFAARRLSRHLSGSAPDGPRIRREGSPRRRCRV